MKAVLFILALTICGLSAMSLQATKIQQPRRSVNAVHSNDLNVCAACEFFVGAIVGYVGGERNPTKIAQRIEAYCDSLPSIFIRQCHSFVNQYKDRLIKFLESGTTPNAICLGLKACTSYTFMEKFMQHQVLRTVSDADCELCVLTIWTVERQLTSNDSVANIVKVLNSVCEALPFGTDQCKQFINQYFPLLIQYLQSKDTPRQICTLLGRCSNSTMENQFKAALMARIEGSTKPMKLITKPVIRPVQLTKPSPLSFKCDVCKFIFDEIYQALGSNTTEQHILNVLHKICNALPFGSSECTAIVDQYLDVLIQYLQQKLPADVICQKIHLCSNSTSTLWMKQDISVMRARLVALDYVKKHPFRYSAQGSSTGCQLCQWLTSAIESWLSDGHTQTDISNTLQQVCNFFPEYASQCAELVQVYTPKLIEELVQIESPPVVCAQIGICK